MLERILTTYDITVGKERGDTMVDKTKVIYQVCEKKKGIFLCRKLLRMHAVIYKEEKSDAEYRLLFMITNVSSTIIPSGGSTVYGHRIEVKWNLCSAFFISLCVEVLIEIDDSVAP